MSASSLKLLQVNTADGSGGAASIALSLHKAYLRRGHDAWLAVKRRSTAYPQVVEIRQDTASVAFARPFWHWEQVLASERFRGARPMRLALRMAADPHHFLDAVRGAEDFHYPATRFLGSWAPIKPDLIHLHNLHGHYFDLRRLPSISQATPTVLTLHDAWLLSGHCAYSLDCMRWQTGCGRCPDLSLYPALWRDGTAANWEQKASIFARSRLFVAAPSRWLMEKAERSMLMPGVRATRIINPGIDLATFRPGDKEEARKKLGLPVEATIVLLVGVSARSNPYKDWPSVESVARRLADAQPPGKLLFLVAGEQGKPRHFGQVTMQFAGSIVERAHMASYYQAADLLLHTARAETWGLVVTEALSCGLPVVATAVGGIPEQVTSIGPEGPEQASGYLVKAGDAQGLAEGIALLMRDSALRRTLGENGARFAQKHFDQERQAADYLGWYRSILAGES